MTAAIAVRCNAVLYNYRSRRHHLLMLEGSTGPPMLVWADALLKHRAIFAAIALLSFDNFSRSALKAHPSSIVALRRAATGPAEES